MADEGRGGNIEKHAQTIVLAVLVGLLAWVGSTLISVDKRTAVIEEKLQGALARLSEMQPASEARRDVADITRRLDAVERRLDQLQQHEKPTAPPRR